MAEAEPHSQLVFGNLLSVATFNEISHNLHLKNRANVTKEKQCWARLTKVTRLRGQDSTYMGDRLGATVLAGMASNIDSANRLC